MTAHKSKGLEFEHVFIPRLTEKTWGNIRDRSRLPLPDNLISQISTPASASLEDERRLFYVALTRAKQGAYLSHASKNSEGKDQASALFWHEVPENLSDIKKITETDANTSNRLTTSFTNPLSRSKTADIKSWLQDILQHYTLSVTHLNHYLECPRLFYFRHLIRVPSATNKHMAFGTAIHNTLYEFFDGDFSPKLTKLFHKHLSDQIFSESDYQDAKLKGEQSLASWHQQYRQSFSQNNLLEYDFKPHHIMIDNLRLTGKIDKIEILNDKEVKVVDYKTGNPDNAGPKMRPDGDYFRQLVFYKLLCNKSKQFKYTVNSGEVDFIQPSSRFKKHIKKKFDITDQDVTNLEETIKNAWQDIQDLKFLDDSVACGHCEYCT